jgi:Mg2+-importing ATPase
VPSARPSGSVAPLVRAAAVRAVPDVLASLNSTPDGIGSAEAAARRARDGANEIASEKPPRWTVQLLHAFHVPFNYLLMALALVALVTDDYRAAVVVSLMVLLSGSLRFWQEFRSNRAAEKLRALVRTTATVCRPPSEPAQDPTASAPKSAPAAPGQEVPLQDLVPGDVVRLSAGDLIPADVRLISAKDLFVSQSALTGESMQVEKADVPPAEARRLLDGGGSPLDLPCVCFMGTSVVSGTARAVVVATGDRTYLGSLARQLTGWRATTAFDKGVRSVSWLLIRFIFVMAPVVFLLNGLTKGDWYEAFLFAVAIAVGLTPEMLPMIVTANLARGAVAMSRHKVIVKKLAAIQNFGAMDVLCTDKTGTLTQDKVVLIRHIDVDGDPCPEVFDYAYLNSHFQTGLKNLLDRAVLEHADEEQVRELARRHLKCDEVPFDFQRRRMSVVVHEVFKGRDLLICKGAAEEVLAVCSEVRVGDRVVPLTDALRAKALALRTDMNQDGLRVIAVAVKQVWPTRTDWRWSGSSPSSTRRRRRPRPRWRPWPGTGSPSRS